MAKQLSLQRNSEAADKSKTGGAQPAPPAITADTRKLVAVGLLIMVAIVCLGGMVLKNHGANGHNEPDLTPTSTRKMSSNGMPSKP